MQIFHQLADVPTNFGPTVATIGNFDGVHSGHQWVIAAVIQRARELGAKSIVVTFDPHPARVLRPGLGPELLTPLAEKLSLLAATGVDATLVLPFTPEVSRLTAHDFAAATLRDGLRSIEVHEGENFRFGQDAQAGVASLESLGKELGFKVRVYAPRRLRGETVSSSRIRQLIAAGDVSRARHLLGRAFAIQGHPAPGRGFGTRYTVPTINFAAYPDLLPGNGVYVTRLTVGSEKAGSEKVGGERVGGEIFQSVTNVGNRPTFGSDFGIPQDKDSFAVESHLLSFHPIELAATTPLTLTFLKRLRAEQKWPSTQALLEQIQKDVARAQRYFHLHALCHPS